MKMDQNGMTSKTDLHEAGLNKQTLDLHRAISSLMEELEAVDWYQQRAESTNDAGLKQIIEHNRDEEIEHAAMVLEWLRRSNVEFDKQLRRYLFTDGDIANRHAGSVDESQARGDGFEYMLPIGSLKEMHES